MHRPYGSGQIYEKSGAYYGRWRTEDGRRLNRRLGGTRTTGNADGLTRAQAVPVLVGLVYVSLWLGRRWFSEREVADHPLKAVHAAEDAGAA